MSLVPLFSLPESEDFALGKNRFLMMMQIYIIYSEKDTEQSEKRYRVISVLLGIFLLYFRYHRSGLIFLFLFSVVKVYILPEEKASD